METAKSLSSIDCLTDLTVSILNGCLCTDSTEKDLLQDITFHSFSGQETAGNKYREFPDLLPFPLPVSREVPLSLLIIMGRKNDSDLSEL